VLIDLISRQNLTRQPWICYSIGIMLMQEASRNSGVLPMTATNAEPDPGRGVYAISVAAELVGMGSQTLRLYERRGLIEPARSAGGIRRYSSDDLGRLRRIAGLVAGGLNLAGVAMVLDLEDANAGLRVDLDADRQLWSPAQSGGG
jgi:MerR family transcriptional regulator/heat shock protein HspR